MKRIYIAGPMTGYPEFNYPAFHAAAARLRTLGHHVENPAENPKPKCGTWRGYMRLAVRQLSTCDAVYLLPGWEGSKGARVEFNLAIGLELEIVVESNDSPQAIAKDEGRRALTAPEKAQRLKAEWRKPGGLLNI